MGTWWMIGQSVLNGISMGGIYALLGVGMTLINGVMKMVNFAQGDFLVIGMYATFVLYNLTGLSPYILIVPVMIIVYGIGTLTFHGIIKPLIGQPGNSFTVATMGLSFVIQSVLQLIFSANFVSVPTEVSSIAVPIGTFSLGLPRIIACVFMVVFVLLIRLMLAKTDLGRAMRATSENIQVAQSLGINTTVMYSFAFALGVTFAAISGVLITPIYYIYPTVGTTFKTIAMTIIILGGAGNIVGAMVSGLLAGLVEAFTATFISNNIAPAAVYVLIVFVLWFKPNGLFGKGQRVA